MGDDLPFYSRRRWIMPAAPVDHRDCDRPSITTGVGDSGITIDFPCGLSCNVQNTRAGWTYPEEIAAWHTLLVEKATAGSCPHTDKTPPDVVIPDGYEPTCVCLACGAVVPA